MRFYLLFTLVFRNFLLRILCFLFVPFICFAQTVEWSHPQNFEKKYPNLKIFGNDATGYFLYKYGENQSHLILEKYDNHMKMLWEKKLNLKEKDVEIKKALLVEKSVLIFYTSPNYEKNILELKIQKFKKDGTPDGDSFTLDEKTTMDKEDLAKPFNITFSDDQKKMLVFHKCPQLVCFKDAANKQVENSTYYFKIYNLIFEKGTKIFSPEWQKEIEVQISYKKTDIEKIEFDSLGNIYALISIFSGDSKKKKPNEISYELLHYSKIKDELKSFSVNINDLFITDLSFKVTEAGKKIIITGFYSSSKNYNILGAVYATLDLEKSGLAIKTFNPFNTKFSEHISLESPSVEDIELSHFAIHEITSTNNGGVVLIAEGTLTRAASYYNAATQTYNQTIIYEYSNILFVSLDNNGRLVWEQAITKRQLSENDDGYYSSYQLVDNNNKFHVVFNEAIKRESDVLQYYTINKNDGDMYAWLLFNAQEDALIIPKASLKLKENQIIIPGLRKTKCSLVKISF